MNFILLNVLNSKLNQKGVTFLAGATVVGETTVTTVKSLSSFDLLLLTFTVWATQQVASNYAHVTAFNSTDKSIYVQYIDYDGNTRNAMCAYLSNTSVKMNVPTTGYYINLYGIKL